MTRKICVITGSRAEYGLLRWVMQGIKDEPSLTLQIIATGMHLSPQFGNTYQEIEGDGFVIDRKVQMLTGSDTPVGIAQSMGNGLIGFADALNELKPDLLVVLGDRFEIFSAVSAALVARIPIAHIHGGELTEGLIDDAIRHSITKMSHLHFVATEDYQNRVIQLGESPSHVFNVGGLGIDNISKTKLMSKEEVEDHLQFNFQERNLLITFHPVTLEDETATEQFCELLAALDEHPNVGLIFTTPNADPGGRVLFGLIDGFVHARKNAICRTSLGSNLYLSCLAQVDGVIGNSSSGLLEVPTFKIGTINIGDRQRGRLTCSSVINCRATRNDINVALTKLFTSEFQKNLQTVVNPNGVSGASERIVDILTHIQIDNILKKVFHDI
jgi:GDP/UDP-N,N'-diacetylbacillosamine 2-epimerase (hydrolysing)